MLAKVLGRPELSPPTVQSLLLKRFGAILRRVGTQSGDSTIDIFGRRALSLLLVGSLQRI